MPTSPSTVAVLDVGCFSAHLLVVDAALGSPEHPVFTHKVRLRLDKSLDENGHLRPDGVAAVVEAVAAARCKARRAGVTEFVPFATSSVRDAANADEVVRQVAQQTGVRLRRFSGRQEAALAYLAARRWFGWSAGPLTVLDVGGGTVELAAGESDRPLVARSLPYGARSLTTMGITNAKTVQELIRSALPAEDLALLRAGQAIGCSKVFQQLGRLVGTGSLRVSDLDAWIPRLARLSARRRAKLPGISRHRAEQSLAGAVAARALMGVTGHRAVRISPWSTKEGLLLALMERGPEAALTDAA
ncbi:exopolyphosphatase [Actinokineospora sp. NBRC 105648]|uniref:Ppx/GppA phosphatase family protein n=1 Tax=Actinokineospora sp. NBRC 105648 TaxID=3032206 RepID=UPI00249FAAF3|nr:exopolyphosphatase [Actinokineospora sp. NBRC 105648]GLZ42968.1 exopolyphosphatase [Actinokineospora sp. NBRC 105648]